MDRLCDDCSLQIGGFATVTLGPERKPRRRAAYRVCAVDVAGAGDGTEQSRRVAAYWAGVCHGQCSAYPQRPVEFLRCNRSPPWRTFCHAPRNELCAAQNPAHPTSRPSIMLTILSRMVSTERLDLEIAIVALLALAGPPRAFQRLLRLENARLSRSVSPGCQTARHAHASVWPVVLTRQPVSDCFA